MVVGCDTFASSCKDCLAYNGSVTQCFWCYDSSLHGGDITRYGSCVASCSSPKIMLLYKESCPDAETMILGMQKDLALFLVVGLPLIGIALAALAALFFRHYSKMQKQEKQRRSTIITATGNVISPTNAGAAGGGGGGPLSPNNIMNPASPLSPAAISASAGSLSKVGVASSRFMRDYSGGMSVPEPQNVSTHKVAVLAGKNPFDILQEIRVDEERQKSVVTKKATPQSSLMGSLVALPAIAPPNLSQLTSSIPALPGNISMPLPDVNVAASSLVKSVRFSEDAIDTPRKNLNESFALSIEADTSVITKEMEANDNAQHPQEQQQEEQPNLSEPTVQENQDYDYQQDPIHHESPMASSSPALLSPYGSQIMTADISFEQNFTPTHATLLYAM